MKARRVFVERFLQGEPISQVLDAILLEDGAKVDFRVVREDDSSWKVYRVSILPGRSRPKSEELGTFTSEEEANTFAISMTKGVGKAYFQTKFGSGAVRTLDID